MVGHPIGLIIEAAASLCRHGLHLLPTSESSLSAARGFTGCTRNTLGRWQREPDRIRFD